MKFSYFFVGIILLSLELFAQSDSVIVFDSKTEILNIGKQVHLLEDKDGKLTIEDIQKPEYQNQFKKSEQEIPNFNTTRSKIWVKFTVSNQTDEKVYLEVAQALAWYIDFYKPNAQNQPILSTQTGMMRPMKNREVDTNFFLFELSKNPQAQTYYFSIQSDFSLIVPLNLAQKDTLMEKSNAHHLYFGMFWGLVGIMFFYNLFVAYSVRDKLYLYYCLYLLTTLILINFASGNFGYRLNPISYIPQYVSTINSLSYFTIFLFLTSLLALPKNSSIYRVFAFSQIISFICAVINLWTGHYVAFHDIVQLNIMLTYIYILVSCIMLYYKGNKNARFVVFGFSFYLLANVIWILQNFGLLESNFYTTNAFIFGISIEVLIFSLALGDRINQMRREKEAALIAKQNTQTELLKKSRENEKLIIVQNKVLAEKVAEKTKDLQSAYEEIQVSNEELQQTQEEILAQRDLLENKNILLEQSTHRIGKSIEAAKTIQNAILPSKSKMQELFAEYFVVFKPKDVVSGDFWWANQIENTKYLIVADCTGHGVSGAMLTMIGSTLLDRIILVLDITEPSEILERLHKEIQNALQQEHSKNSEGMDIAVICWYEENEEYFLSFSAAKRPLYFVSNRKIEKLAGSRKMIGGLWDSSKSFETKTLTLPAGTTLYLSSDGFADQNNVERSTFSEKRLANLLEELQDLPMAEQKEILKNQLESHMEGTEQRDDILLVGVRI